MARAEDLAGAEAEVVVAVVVGRLVGARSVEEADETEADSREAETKIDVVAAEAAVDEIGLDYEDGDDGDDAGILRLEHQWAARLKVVRVEIAVAGLTVVAAVVAASSSAAAFGLLRS